MNSHQMDIVIIVKIREEELPKLISSCCISHLDIFFFISNGSLCSQAWEREQFYLLWSEQLIGQRGGVG